MVLFRNVVEACDEMVPDVRTLVFLLALVRGLEFAGADGK